MKSLRSLCLALALGAGPTQNVCQAIDRSASSEVVIAQSVVGQTCAGYFLVTVPALVRGPVARVSLSSLRALPLVLVQSGLTRGQANQTMNALTAVLSDPQAPRVCRELGSAARAAFYNDDVLGICALHQECDFKERTTAMHVSSGHPFSMRSFFGGEQGGKLAWVDREVDGLTQFKADGLWQGLVLKLEKQESAADTGTLLVNVLSLLHELGYFDAMSRLSAWAVHIQAGGKPHPRVAKYISPDGRELDEGFVRLVMETRAMRAEIEAQGVFLRQIGLNAQLGLEAALEKRQHDGARTLKSIRDYGTITKTVLEDFRVTLSRLYDLGEELADLLDWRE